VSGPQSVPPDTPIILGGKPGGQRRASPPFCKVDICAIGEGEHVMLNLVKLLEENHEKLNLQALQNVRGISFLTSKGNGF